MTTTKDKPDQSGGGGGISGGQGPKPETYTFFVGQTKYETDQPTLTGLQIKAKVSEWNQDHDLLLEGQGNDPDRLIMDTDLVQLTKVHGPLRFSSVPKATFGK